MQKKILIIDDSSFFKLIATQILKAENYLVIGETSSGEEGLKMAMELDPNLIIIDNLLSDCLGTDLIEKIKSNPNIDAKIMMASSLSQSEVVALAKQKGVDEFFCKPENHKELSQELLKMVRKLIGVAR